MSISGAGGHQAGSGAEGGAVDGADDRLEAFADGVGAFAHLAGMLPVGAGFILVGTFLQIGPGGEHVAGAGEDGDANIFAIIETIEGAREFVPEGGVLSVDGWAVDGDDSNIVRHFHADGGVHLVGFL